MEMSLMPYGGSQSLDGMKWTEIGHKMELLFVYQDHL